MLYHAAGHNSIHLPDTKVSTGAHTTCHLTLHHALVPVLAQGKLLVHTVLLLCTLSDTYNFLDDSLTTFHGHLV